jgi:hypothetical protein
MDNIFKQMSTILFAIMVVIGIITVGVFVFAGPAWYIWNDIISPKFGLPIFSFWEAFLTVLMIKLLIQPLSSFQKNSDLKNIKD